MIQDYLHISKCPTKSHLLSLFARKSHIFLGSDNRERDIFAWAGGGIIQVTTDGIWGVHRGGVGYHNDWREEGQWHLEMGLAPLDTPQGLRRSQATNDCPGPKWLDCPTWHSQGEKPMRTAEAKNLSQILSYKLGEGLQCNLLCIFQYHNYWGEDCLLIWCNFTKNLFILLENNISNAQSACEIQVTQTWL